MLPIFTTLCSTDVAESKQTLHRAVLMSLKMMEENQVVLINQQKKILNKLGCIEDVAEEVLDVPCSSVENLEELSTSLEESKEERRKLVSIHMVLILLLKDTCYF